MGWRRRFQVRFVHFQRNLTYDLQDCLFLLARISNTVQGLCSLPALYRFGFVVLQMRHRLDIDWVQAIVLQRIIYGNAPPLSVLLDDEDLEQALALAEE